MSACGRAGAAARGRCPSGARTFRPGTALFLALLAACAPDARPIASPSAPQARGAATDGETASRNGPPASAHPAAPGSMVPANPASREPSGRGAHASLSPAPDPTAAPETAPPAASPGDRATASPPAGDPSAPTAAGGERPAGPGPAPLPLVRAEARGADGVSALRPGAVTPVSRDASFEVAISIRAPEARLQLLDARDAVVPSSGSTVVSEETRFLLAPDEALRPGAEYALRLEGIRSSTVAAADGRTFQPLSLRVRVVGAPAPDAAAPAPGP
jgi:hypothetical protein